MKNQKNAEKKLIVEETTTETIEKKDKEEKTDAIKFKEEYESLNGTIREKDGQTIRTIKIDEENPIVYATAEEIVKKIEKKETFAVYFGFSDCPWCRSVLPTLIEVANDLKISKIYYVDVKEIRDVLVVEDEKIKTEKEGKEGHWIQRYRIQNRV